MTIKKLSKATKLPFKYFLFNWGYVESASLAVLPMCHNEGFGTFKEAIESLKGATVRAYGYEKGLTDWEGNILVEETEDDLGDCCKVVLEYYPDDNFCRKCGTQLKEEKLVVDKKLVLDDTTIVQFFHEIFFGDMNDVGSFSDIFEDKGWHFDLPPKTSKVKPIFVEHLDRWLDFERNSWWLKWDSVKP